MIAVKCLDNSTITDPSKLKIREIYYAHSWNEKDSLVLIYETNKSEIIGFLFKNLFKPLYEIRQEKLKELNI